MSTVVVHFFNLFEYCTALLRICTQCAVCVIASEKSVREIGRAIFVESRGTTGEEYPVQLAHCVF